MESLMRGNKLYSASVNGDINLLNQLLEEDRYVLEDYGSSVGFCLNGTPLHIAATRGHLEFAEVLLHHKPQFVCELDSRSRTPLHLAVSNGKVNMVRLLLEQICLEDNNIRLMMDESGRTPLHLASAKGILEMVQLLLEKADDNVCLLTDEFGRTPLHLAVLMNAKPEVVQYLITKKPKAIADLLSSSKTVRILHSYILHNGVEVLQIFVSVEESISVDLLLCSQDEEGNTILHKVISLRNEKMLKMLIPKNENDWYPVAVNLTNRNNLTVLDLIYQMPMDSKTKAIRKRFTRHPDVHTEEKNWFDNRKNSMIVAVTLIAGMSYQSGLNPPGGVWDEDKVIESPDGIGNTTAAAGTSIMYVKNPLRYDIFWTFNTVSFVTALILLLLLLMHGTHRKYVNRCRGFLKRIYIGICTCILWLTGVSVAIAYGTATLTISDDAALSSAFVIAVVCLLTLFGLFLIFSLGKGLYHLIRFIKRIVKKFSKRIRAGNNNGTNASCFAFV